jgi:hypothetical protein
MTGLTLHSMRKQENIGLDPLEGASTDGPGFLLPFCASGLRGRKAALTRKQARLIRASELGPRHSTLGGPGGGVSLAAGSGRFGARSLAAKIPFLAQDSMHRESRRSLGRRAQTS